MQTKELLVEEFCHNVMCRRENNQGRAGALWWEIAPLISDDTLRTGFKDAWLHYEIGHVSIESFVESVKQLKEHIMNNDVRLL